MKTHKFVSLCSLGAVLLCLLQAGCLLTGPTTPYDWGYTSNEIFNRESCSYDSTAPACILYDIGDMVLDVYPFRMKLNRHVRIRIYRAGAEEYANIRIPYWDKELVISIRAQTILPDGQVIKLKKKDIFNEGEDEGWGFKVFAIPGVSNNCIIEYRYEFLTPYLARLNPWYFQNEIHTELSKVSLEIVEGYQYNTYHRNFGADAKPSMETVIKPDGKRRKRITWEYTDLSPVRKEPHITALKDYMISLDFQLIKYSDRFNLFSFVQTWEDLKAKIEPAYKPYLKSNRKIRKLTSELTDSITADEDIVETLFHFVRDSIETSRYRGCWGDKIRRPGDLLSSGHGSRVEKNLLLVSLLRTAGLNAEPLLISTRANGRLYTQSPRADSFNHLLVFMGRPAKFRLLDASDPFCPVTLLPARYLTNKGWLILTGDSEGLVTIPTVTSVSAQVATIDSARIDSAGNLEGQATIRYEGYRGIHYRRLLAESKTEREFIEEEVFDIFNNAEIDTFQVLFADIKESPLVVIVRFKIPGFAETAGDKIYFSPTLFQQIQENQFRLEKRTYPVEYNFPAMDQEKITFELPANYAIIEAPENIEWKIRGQEFRRLLTRNADGRLNYYRKLHITEVYYSPAEYEMLKNFTAYIVEADGDQLILQRQSN